MTKKRKAERESKGVLQPVFRFIETPFSVEIKSFASGEYACIVGGVRQILLYETEEMSFSCGSFALSVTGKKLQCNTYQNGYIQVVGYIENIRLRS